MGLFYMRVMCGCWCVSVWIVVVSSMELEPGFPMQCAISIIPCLDIASNKWKLLRFQRDFPSMFCYICTASGLCSIALYTSCFTVCFHFILPSADLMTSCPYCLPFINCCPDQSFESCRDSWPNQPSKNIIKYASIFLTLANHIW